MKAKKLEDGQKDVSKRLNTHSNHGHSWRQQERNFGPIDQRSKMAEFHKRSWQCQRQNRKALEKGKLGSIKTPTSGFTATVTLEVTTLSTTFNIDSTFILQRVALASCAVFKLFLKIK